MTAEYRIICNEEVAKAIIEAGYGDMKQAVREFAERLREEIAWGQPINDEQQALETIDELLAEVTGK